MLQTGRDEGQTEIHKSNASCCTFSAKYSSNKFVYIWRLTTINKNKNALQQVSIYLFVK